MHSVIKKTGNTEKKKTDTTGKNKYLNFMFSFQYLILHENKTLKSKISVMFIALVSKKYWRASTGIQVTFDSEAYLQLNVHYLKIWLG